MDNAKVITQQIRELYPNPVSSKPERGPDEYCVGKAVCLYADRYPGEDETSDAFPSIEAIAEGLKGLSIALEDDEDEQAWDFANMIVQLNDAEKFDLAWKKVEEALAWHS